MLVLGLDVGGTKTVGQLADGDGTVLREARGGGANLQSVGELGVEKVLHEVIDAALADSHERLSAICVGMAGVDRPQDGALVREILGRIGQRAASLVVNDALIALEAGAPDGPGIVVIAGTGSIAYGRDPGGRAARAGGWGYVLGDEGSGYWLGRQALRAVVRASDGRGQATSLTPRILEHFHVTRAYDLVHQIYGQEGGLKLSTIAALASCVESAAAEADPVATDLIRLGAQELAGVARSVAQRLSMEQTTIVLAGGIFRAVPHMLAAVSAKLRELLPRATVRPLTVEPALGAVRFALKLATGGVVIPQYV